MHLEVAVGAFQLLRPLLPLRPLARCRLVLLALQLLLLPLGLLAHPAQSVPPRRPELDVLGVVLGVPPLALGLYRRVRAVPRLACVSVRRATDRRSLNDSVTIKTLLLPPELVIIM